MRLLIDSKNGSFEELDRAQDRYKIYPPREMAISLEIGTIEGTFNGSLALEKSWQYLALGHREINRLIQETAKPRVAALKHQTRSGILCIYKIGIIDGKGRERNGKVVGMFHSEDGKVSEVDPRSVWDYEDDSSTQNANTNFIFNSLKRIEDELKRIVDTFHIETSRKLRDIEEKTRDASIGYFANKIGQAQEKRREYERNLKEGPQFEKLISRKKTEIQNLRNESDERLSAIKREFLSHSTAELVGIGTISSDIEASIRREIEVAGMNAVLEYERKRANIEDRSKIKDVSERDCGYDIESFDRMIEVKSFKMTGFVKLTSHEWETARRLQDDYWLYVVETAFDNPTIHTIQNPYEQFKNKVKVEEIIDYRYVIEDWK